MWGSGGGGDASSNEQVDVSNLTSAQRDAMMDGVKQQVAIANAQELVSKLTNKCVRKCMTKPGTALDKYDKTCLSNCMDRFIDSLTHVSNAYQQRIQQEQQGGGHI